MRHQDAAGWVRYYGGEVNGALGSWVNIGPEADLAHAVAALDGLWKTEGLFISHPAFNDAMAASLPRFPSLRLADFPGTALTDAGAMALAAKGYPLQRVDLSGTRVTERGASALRRTGASVYGIVAPTDHR